MEDQVVIPRRKNVRNMRWFDPFAAIEYLKGNITIKPDEMLADGTVKVSKHIFVKRNSLGLRMLGALDYLKNFHHYTYSYR